MTIPYESYGEKLELSFKVTEYNEPRNLAILIMSKDSSGLIEPYASLTTNITEFSKNTYGCVDTNNFPEAIDIIEKYNLGSDTGIRISSGYCSYPVYDFNITELNKYKYIGY